MCLIIIINFDVLVMQNRASLQALQRKCIAVYGQVDQVRLLKFCACSMDSRKSSGAPFYCIKEV